MMTEVSDCVVEQSFTWQRVSTYRKLSFQLEVLAADSSSIKCNRFIQSVDILMGHLSVGPCLYTVSRLLPASWHLARCFIKTSQCYTSSLLCINLIPMLLRQQSPACDTDCMQTAISLAKL